MNEELAKNRLIWKSEYNINNFKIDREHQKLFNIAREAIIISKLNDSEAKIKLKEIITKLFDYVATHFVNEQKYMEEINYPDIEEHIFLHKNMTNMLTSLIPELNKLELKEIEKSLFNFIDEFFVKHIILEDKKIELWNSSICDLKKNFHWKGCYSVGNIKLDNDHKMLFEIVQEIFVDSELNIRHEKIKEVLINLYKHLKSHFKYEEKYMRQIKYPDYEKHKIEHDTIMEELNSFVKQLPDFEENLFERELIRILDTSLIDHIIKEDTKITDWEKINLTINKK